MPKIPEYPNLAAPNNNDMLVIEDSLAANTKNITREDFLSGTPLPANTVDTQAIADFSVTQMKIFPAAILVDLKQRTANFNSTATRQAVPGLSISLNVPSGKKVRLTFKGTALTGSAGTKQAEIHIGSISGTTNRIAIHNDLSGSATTQLGFTLVHIDEPAAGSVTYIAALNTAELVAGIGFPAQFTAELL